MLTSSSFENVDGRGTRLAQPFLGHQRPTVGRRKPGRQTMAQKSLEERVDMLEQRVELLIQLPERVSALETQIVLLRDEMRAEFSATRADARERDEETRRFMRVLYEDLVARLELLGGSNEKDKKSQLDFVPRWAEIPLDETDLAARLDRLARKR